MSHYVYIIYSSSKDKFYVGETIDLERRITQHNTHIFSDSYTRIASDWELFWSGHCPNRKVGLSIESHIKRMRSRKYYYDLKKYPSIFTRLKERYH